MNELIEEAKKCDGCVNWLHHCHAECCRGFFVAVKDKDDIIGAKTLLFRTILTKDLEHYYKLHGCKYIRGVLYVPLKKYIITAPHEIFVVSPCKALSEDELCTIHDKSSQPLICKHPSMSNYHNLSGVKITPNCVFRYKLEGEGYGLG